MKGEETLNNNNISKVFNAIVVVDHRETPSIDNPEPQVEKNNADFRSSAFKGSPFKTQKQK